MLDKAMEHLAVLATRIGPRGTATEGEREAARYTQRVLRECGYEVETQPFLTVTTFSWPFLILYLLPAVVLLLSRVTLAGGFLLSLITTAMFFLELNSIETISRLLPKGESCNVVGRQNKSEAKRKVVLVAHLDSSKAALNFSPKMVRNFRSSFLLMVASIVGSFVFQSLAFFLRSSWLILGAMPFVIYLLITSFFLLHRERWNYYTHGANDNASGVAVALTLATEMRELLSETELWCVLTGAEEAGTFGMIRFIEQYGNELKHAYFLNLDNIGAGAVHFMSGEGMFPTFKSSPELIELCRKVQTDAPELGVRQGVYNLMSTDALPALVRGHKAISFLAVDESGLLPNWHWTTDTYENVQQSTIEQALTFVSRLLEQINSCYS